jgi:outer membrane protein
MKKQMIIALAAVAAMASGSAFAYEAGDWTFKAGLTNVNPEQTNGNLALGSTDLGELVVEDATTLSLLGVWHISPSFGLELLASLPFDHDFSVGGAVGGTTKQLPPTLSLQYYFNTEGKFIPYVGVGVNYTNFFSTKTFGDLAGVDVDIEDSWGGAVQAGIDYFVSEQMFMNLDVRWIQIESDVKVNGANVGQADINPVVIGINVGYLF